MIRQEGEAGLRLCERARLTGNIEFDATSLGKYWIKPTNENFREKIEAVCKNLAAHEKPKSLQVHVMVLGAVQRTGKPIVYGPEEKVLRLRPFFAH